MFKNHSTSSFVCISYISAPLIHKNPRSIILEFSEKNYIYIYMPKKIMVFCHQFVERKCFMILIFCTCDKVNLYQFYYMKKNYKSSILFEIFNFETCNVCKALIRGFHILSVDVKVGENMK
jgi:homoserine trans-succinylase